MVKQRNARLMRRLQCFEAAARLGSVAKAAEELGVTASAVSHQLADLRRAIGEDLFSRSGRGIVLTDAGTMLAQRTSTAFKILDASITDAIGGSERAVIQVAACSSFGPYWLVPRISEFNLIHPGIDIDFRLYAEDPELTHASADCIITAQDVKPGYYSVDLFEEASIAVAAPGLVAGGTLKGIPLITTDTDDASFAAEWKSFAASRSKRFEIGQHCTWVRCSHYVLALEAAKSGLGVALIPDFVCAKAIRAGNLIDLGLGSFNNDGRVYRACYKEARRVEPSLKQFVSWLGQADQGP